VHTKTQENKRHLKRGQDRTPVQNNSKVNSLDTLASSGSNLGELKRNRLRRELAEFERVKNPESNNEE
jgi:hypothetical protein